MLSSIEADIESQLTRRHEKGNLRSLVCKTATVDFASNDYLGLAQNGDLKRLILQAWSEKQFLGATGSRLLTGNHPLFEEVENAIASFHCAKAGLIFNSGYNANLGLLSAIAGPQDVCLYDAHIHASMHDGMRLSGSTCYPWRHNNLDHLESRLKSFQGKKRIFVCIESLYSCDGSQSPLLAICQLCERYGVNLIVDEAHASGVWGPDGKGLVVEQGCEGRVFARIHTFSKALGLHGAIVLGSPSLISFLINFSRTFIYSTAMPVPGIIGIREAYKTLPQLNHLRSNLKSLITYFRTKAESVGLAFHPSSTQIQALMIPGNIRARALANELSKYGIDARTLLSPTVQRGKECLRICLHAFNTKNEIDELFNAAK